MSLHYETVTPQLRSILEDLMGNSVFDPFYLVGGTSLSLRLGHRMSVDIDLFTNATYGSLDFSVFESYLRDNYNYYYCTDITNIVGMGRSYYVGDSEDDHIKLDMYYRDEMTDNCDIIDGIRLASMEDVIGMKVDVISRQGRKKDFWDLHELFNSYTIEEILAIHAARYEYTHNREEIIANFTDFSLADEEIDPICLKDKEWELIKLDFVENIESIQQNKDNN